MTQEKIVHWCPLCGNQELEFDAMATWDFEKQEFVVADVGDRVWCSECLEDVFYMNGTPEHQKEAREQLLSQREAEWGS